MKASEMTNDELAKELLETVGLDGPFCICERCSTVREAAARLRKAVELTPESATEMCRRESAIRAKLKVAEDALGKASDAFRFCIEQCELELGPKMIGKLCDDGKACERALAAIREEGGES